MLGEITGEEWRNELKYHNLTNGKEFTVKDPQLTEKLKRNFKDSPIISIEGYKCPLNRMASVRDGECKNKALFHMFITFETEDWYWSLEKEVDAIELKRSKDYEELLNVQSRPKPNTLMKKNNVSNFTLHELIDWLYNSDQLNKTYTLYLNDCQTFADDAYLKISGQELGSKSGNKSNKKSK